jgi:hypothetical protein
LSADPLRLEYDQTMQLVRSLTEVRFKLLAFVPTIAGFGVGSFGKPRPAAQLVAIGLLGLVATLGIFVYELRNSQIYASAVRRAGELERTLELAAGPGSLLAERGGRAARLFGLFAVWQNRGLALVYGAALAGWSYLVAWGALHALDVGSARKIGAAVGVVAGALVVLGIARLDTRSAA